MGGLKMRRVASAHNPQIRALRALLNRRGREEAHCFLVEGEKMAEEALTHAAVSCAVVEEGREERFKFLLAALEEAGARILVSPRHVLETLCETKTPQGIVVATAMPEFLRSRSPALGERLVALDGVQDPGNLGTILRTADAAGFQGLLLGRGCADVYGGKALRASVGSVFRVPAIPAPALAKRLALLRAEGYAVLSSQLDGEDFFARAPLPRRVVLVIGSEGEGVSPEVSEAATHRLRLPMYGDAESLNASVAAGIMLYDLAREREKQNNPF
jgi:TrmH family RNA methyltransferase